MNSQWPREARSSETDNPRTYSLPITFTTNIYACCAAGTGNGYETASIALNAYSITLSELEIETWSISKNSNANNAYLRLGIIRLHAIIIGR